MQRIKIWLAVLAFSACATADALGTDLASAPPDDAARGGFFVVPSRPLAYSFSDICDLSIDPRRATTARAIDDEASTTPGLAAVWFRTAGTRPAAGDGKTASGEDPASTRRLLSRIADERESRPADRHAASSRDGGPFSFVSMPEPAPWMELCGLVIIALIAKRRRDWSALRGLALGHPAPLRPRSREASR